MKPPRMKSYLVTIPWLCGWIRTRLETLSSCATWRPAWLVVWDCPTRWRASWTPHLAGRGWGSRGQSRRTGGWWGPNRSGKMKSLFQRLCLEKTPCFFNFFKLTRHIRSRLFHCLFKIYSRKPETLSYYVIRIATFDFIRLFQLKVGRIFFFGNI